MNTYKTIEHLKEEAIKNNGKPVYIWDDGGIKVNGKKYYLFEYGSMEYNFKGNHYVTFRNEGHKGRVNRNNPLGTKDIFITIEYKLNSGKLFEFILVRETFLK
jgi:hypothetical protein